MMNRTRTRSRLLVAVLLWLAATAYANVTLVPQLPQAERVGSGVLTWFGMTVYQASLFAENGAYRADRPHALRIDYRFNFSARQLAQRTLDEIERIHGTLVDRETLLAQLQAVMRDVAPGDHLMAIHYPGMGADFYRAGERLGRLESGELARMFFSIWLAPETREPRLREQLLGSRP